MVPDASHQEPIALIKQEYMKNTLEIFYSKINKLFTKRNN